MVDQNSLFNKNTRIMAFDDSPFSREDKFTSLVGLVIRKDLYIESLAKDRIEVDGLDVTAKVLRMIGEKGEGVKVIMVKGITFAGFNVLNLKTIHDETGICIMNVMDHEPDPVGIKNALVKHFPDWKTRMTNFKNSFVKFSSLYLQTEGIEPETANKFIGQVTVNGIIPEPLRIVDMIARIN